ncbi:YjjW family glycine radical enzyme activase [Tissierella carlieri]|uniref:YjjW family glycine radical enzyme activase n=1 Tax=Tissierella carlieri TaxID=689904 RepID=A0ABT1SBN1_9FIRM|nr:YjjW family glycine radical enzyme activase [Tissierella carlieri]MCQ4923892.1 YjjW family glycine radical enzyme activase [Tissierella carlieri]
MNKAKINKIIDMSVVDGPGNRTAIFFQGCNFNCFYCHNPETINHCINCLECIVKCPENALDTIDNKVIWNSSKCVDCDTCIKTCKYDASPKIYNMTVEDIIKRIEHNRPFIKGITTSGGECTLQAKFLVELFKETHKIGLTNFVDTNGGGDLSEEKELVETADKFILDIKAMDRDEHFYITKQYNDVVIKNAKYLAGLGKLYEIRTVVIKGINNYETIDSITKLLQPYLENQDIRYRITRYRPFGVRQHFSNHEPPDDEEMEKLKSIAVNNGFKSIILV